MFGKESLNRHQAQGDRSLPETPDSGRGPAGLPSSPGRAFASLDRASGRDAPELEVGTGALGRSPVLEQLREASRLLRFKRDPTWARVFTRWLRGPAAVGAGFRESEGKPNSGPRP